MSREIVTAYYNDLHRLDWKNIIGNSKLTVYHKNDQLKVGESIDGDHIEIPNCGRCDYAFLWHIIQNYDNLADTNIFTKINWKDNNLSLEKLLYKSEKYHYCESGAHKEFHVYVNNLNQRIDEHPSVKNRAVHDMSNPDSIYLFEGDGPAQFYRHIFKNTPLPKSQIIWGHGPCFAVSRDLIRRHPKTVYEWLLNRFHIESNSWNNEKAKEQLKHKYSDDDLQKQIMIEIGVHYHNQLLRFWKILFTHNIDESKYNIEIS